ncbi:DUF2793 domain-containing protein [Qipengyuania sp.]|uniref:DUF2793 domain-containing protein n=1 Tax=Qipengyuania sp. TaxID=2004515 RepID=UPI0035C861A8
MTDPLSRTARFDLPYLFAGQAQREVFVNEALARIDTAMHPAIADSLAEPPPNPQEGDCYLIVAPAGGAWEGQEGALASFGAGAWQLQKPLAGMRIWDRPRAAWAHFDGAAWKTAEMPPAPEGGGTIDAEARAAITQILDRLREVGIFSLP